eukprot:scaffold104733_cov38-Cyclotella_meneghiniana.AAC.2
MLLTPQTPDPPPRPRGRSEAHHLLCSEKAVFISFDTEIGGEYAGIIQLSAELSRLYIERPYKKSIYSKDTLEEVYREPETFNKYVNPGRGVHFEEHCVAVHGLHPSDPRITGADKLTVVWAQFCEWIERNTSPDEVAILVAYNGENCDMKWLWMITQAPFSPNFSCIVA